MARIAPGTRTFDIGTRRKNPDPAMADEVPYVFEALDATDVPAVARMAVEIELIQPLRVMTDCHSFGCEVEEDVEYGYWRPNDYSTFVLVGTALVRRSERKKSGWEIRWRPTDLFKA